MNNNGQKLREFFTFSSLQITKTSSQEERYQQVYTICTSRGLRSLIDYIIVNQKIATQALITYAFGGYNVSSDHNKEKSKGRQCSAGAKRITQEEKGDLLKK